MPAHLLPGPTVLASAHEVWTIADHAVAGGLVIVVLLLASVGVVRGRGEQRRSHRVTEPGR